jgi:hypothetical protein
MPSPFPGMDPYLESPLHWRDVHHRLAVEISRRLSSRLAPRYVARLETRLVAFSPDEEEISILYPDVEVTRKQLRDLAIKTYEAGTDSADIDPASADIDLASGDAVSPLPLFLRVITPEQVELITVEIRDAAQGRLVTAIEILSPVNKRPGKGLEEYRAKRETVLLAHAHLLEIDLLRKGTRPPRLIGLPQSDYFIFLTRAERRNVTETWPLSVRDPLPVVPVPLLPGDDDVSLNLNHALHTIYDEARYDLSIDYSQPPIPPLSEEDAAWAQALLNPEA